MNNLNHSLGGPTEGNCTVHSWLTYADGGPLPDHSRDDQDRGVQPWAEFIASIAAQGGSRPTFDLFDVPAGLGRNRRYRAMSAR